MFIHGNHASCLAIERQSLRAMDPATPIGGTAGTVKDRIDELGSQRAAAQELARQFNGVQQGMSPQDWISYTDRVKGFGEMAAMRWFLDKSKSH